MGNRIYHRGIKIGYGKVGKSCPIMNSLAQYHRTVQYIQIYKTTKDKNEKKKLLQQVTLRKWKVEKYAYFFRSFSLKKMLQNGKKYGKPRITWYCKRI